MISEDAFMDPVSCLHTYIDRTAANRPKVTKPLFITVAAISSVQYPV